MPNRYLDCNEPDDCFVCKYKDCVNNSRPKLNTSDFIEESIIVRKPQIRFKGTITAKNIKTNEILTFKSIRECGLYFGFAESSISYRLRHPERSYEGWIFKRKAF